MVVVVTWSHNGYFSLGQQLLFWYGQGGMPNKKSRIIYRLQSKHLERFVALCHLHAQTLHLFTAYQRTAIKKHHKYGYRKIFANNPHQSQFSLLLLPLKSGNAVEIVAQINPHFFAEVSHSRALFLVTSFKIFKLGNKISAACFGPTVQVLYI